jgi:hypothetical protein
LLPPPFFNIIARLFISCSVFANTNEIKEPLNFDFEANKTVKNTEIKSSLNEDDFWFCYETNRETSYNFMTQETITTVTYHCTWYDL